MKFYGSIHYHVPTSGLSKFIGNLFRYIVASINLDNATNENNKKKKNTNNNNDSNNNNNNNEHNEESDDINADDTGKE